MAVSSWQNSCPALCPCPAAGGSPGLKSPLRALAIDVAADGTSAKTPLVAKPAPSGGSGSGAAAAGGGEVTVWGGIKALLRNPHHAAFFAIALLMGVG